MCVCIFVLVIQDSKRIFFAPHCIVICRLSGYIVFFTLPCSGTISEKKVIEYKVILLFCTLPETLLVPRKIQRDISINIHRFLYKVPNNFVNFIDTLIILTGFRKILKYRFSWKSARWEPRYSDGRQSYMTKLFANLGRRQKKTRCNLG